jgi:hypothetical protein
MNVDSILISDYASMEPSGKLYVSGVFNRIGAHAFPAMHPIMGVSLVIHGHSAEAGTEHEVEVRLLNVNREPIVPPLKSRFQFGEDQPGGIPLRQITLHRLLGVVFAEPGVYAFEVFIDGVYHASASLLLESAGG